MTSVLSLNVKSVKLLFDHDRDSLGLVDATHTDLVLHHHRNAGEKFGWLDPQKYFNTKI